MKAIAMIIMLTLLHNSAQGHVSPGTILFVAFGMIAMAARRKPKQTASTNVTGSVTVSPAKFVGFSAIASFVLIALFAPALGMLAGRRKSLRR